MIPSSEVAADSPLDADEVRDAWPVLASPERLEAFRILPRPAAEELFFSCSASEQVELVFGLPVSERRSWVRLLAPDDMADFVQAAPEESRTELLALLEVPMRIEVTALLAYDEDEAGGLMSPRFARVRPDMTVDEAIVYLRRQARLHLETIYYAYVLDAEQRLLGVVSFRDLFRAPPASRVDSVMRTDLITVYEDTDQEMLGRIFAQNQLVAIPVIDRDERMKGIVTVDDIVEVVAEEATEDIQKMGGTEALEAPYLTISLAKMIRKRAVWLAVFFLGETLTATAMSYFEGEIAKAVVLALFVPLIISSGGNSGSQASTLVIRAMALGEVRMREWWRVAKRELAAGLVLGAILGTIGVARILLGNAITGSYGDQALGLGLTVGISLVGVVTFGTLTGASLPFALRALRLDPASASAPFVSTLVDVTGLVIYFSVAAMLLG